MKESCQGIRSMSFLFCSGPDTGNES